MEHVRSFAGAPAIADIQSYLASKKDVPFETSELYSSEHDAKILDLKQRKSRFRLFADDEIFRLVEQTVQMLNETDKEYSYLLHKNDITEIRYQEGDYFKRHKDYLSTTSNLIEEFTMILCVTPPEESGAVEGGETVIFSYNQEDGVAFDTTTPGSGLIFRKDLEHAGNLLKSGEKHILTANLWATRKQNSNQVLLVTFDEDQEAKSLQQAADSSNSYALPIDCLRGTMLDAHVRFVNQGYEQQGQEVPPIVVYKCTDFDFESFDTVAKIMRRSYIDEECIRRDAACIDYFGPFCTENLLVNLSTEKVAEESASKKTKTNDGSAKAVEQDTTSEDDENNMDVIVCENESRTKVVLEVARQLGEPYVPFRMLFVEGFLHSFDGDGGHAGYSSVPVTPMACLLGDQNNIFALRKVNARIYGIEARSLKEFHTKYNFWDDEISSDMDDESDDERRGIFRDFEHETEFLSNGRGFGLKFAFGKDSILNTVTDFIFRHPYPGYDSDGAGTAGAFLSGLDTSDSDSESEETQEDSSSAHTTSMFHRDSDGNIAFNADEAKAASDFIASMDLDERVKACLQKKRFELPQESKEMEGLFCNDEVYGNFNILWVTGVVRLDPAASKGYKQKDFNVWPAENNRLDAKTYRHAKWEESYAWSVDAGFWNED